MAENTTTFAPTTPLGQLFQVNDKGQPTVELVKPIAFARALDVVPQMVYTYVRKGRLESVTEPTTGKKLLKATSAAEWASQYLSRKAAKAAKVEAELAGEEQEEVVNA